MPKWQWLLLQATRRLWVRASLLAALGIGGAAVATVADRILPWRLPFDIGADAVDSILSIIASSMLAVTTFSLSVMTQAFGTATSNVTPRATSLLVEDRVTQNVLSTFLGSFLFSIVGIVVLKAGAYGPQGKVVIFLLTIFVLGMIVVSLLRWIDHLTTLGRVGETTDRVEKATRKAIETRLDLPYLGGRLLSDAARGAGAVEVVAGRTGYVLHIDMAALSDFAECVEGDICLRVIPGAFAYDNTVLLSVEAAGFPEDREAALSKLRDAVTIGGERSYDQDPRFGLSVLSEVASRALSPGVNDPGTAIDVVGRLTRLLTLWAEGGEGSDPEDVKFPRIHVPPLQTRDLFDDAFRAIARDGAGNLEVQLRIRKALAALAKMGDAAFRAAALEQAELALERADLAMDFASDSRRLHEVSVQA